MSEVAKNLRFLIPADKEIATQTLNIAAQISGELFVSALSTEYSRKYMSVYNNSDAGSGEVYIGGLGVTPANGMILEKGKWIDLQISAALPVYFVADSGGCEIRVVELA
jgi:hypothetical protein